jgi:hypothetical protein
MIKSFEVLSQYNSPDSNAQVLPYDACHGRMHERAWTN